MIRKVLNYPGSKWRIADRLVDLIPQHHTYLEPYFGSGAVFFRKRPSDIETINDIDGDIVNLFGCIKEDPERLSRLLMAIPYSRQVYNDACKDISVGDRSGTEYERACRFLTCCWQSRSYRATGEKTGWRIDIKGREKMYALWDWYRLPGWVAEIAERLRMVQIESRPALELIRRFDCPEAFIYLDPPYLYETRRGKQYRHEMDATDHEALLTEILSNKARIMISGYQSDMYDGMLAKWNRTELESNDNTGRRRKEVVWMNYEADQIRLPV